MLLKFADSMGMVVANTLFKKEGKLVTFESGCFMTVVA